MKVALNVIEIKISESMKKGDLIKFTFSGQVVIYLGVDGDDCYKFWHRDWGMCWFSADTLPETHYEVINEAR